MSTPPKIFISYSHDSPSHKQWVLKVATDLRANGVDAALDQWDLGPGDDIPQFMEKGLSEADRVVVICSKSYVDKANGGHGGVGYEKRVVSGELYHGSPEEKFIPILRAGSPADALPSYLKSKSLRRLPC